MKHLKSFNEDITSFNFEEELQEFCDNNLAYLLDEGEVRIDETHTGYIIRIKFDEAKSWIGIKDHIIPFATRLNNKYEMLNYQKKTNYAVNADVVIYFYGVASITTKIENIIEDNLKIPEVLTKLSLDKPQISDMSIYITGYKKPKKGGILTKIKSFFK
jgi:hypothetical protein